MPSCVHRAMRFNAIATRCETVLKRLGTFSSTGADGQKRSERRLLVLHPVPVESRFGARTDFSDSLRRVILGSSLSSGAARGCLRIRHEALVDSVGDAPLEAPQRLLAGFAFRDLLAVVGTTRCVRPGLAYGDHVQGVVELAVPAQREPVAHHITALEASSGAVPE